MASRRCSRAGFLIAALFVLVAVGTARGSAPDLFGVGPRSAAMGGGGVAFSDDWEAAYTNPAGLGFAQQRRLTFGALVASYQLSLDGAPHPIDDTNGFFIGVQLPIPFGGVLANRVVLGLAFYLPFGVVNRARSPFPDVPRLAVLDDRTQTVSLSLSAGIRITRNFSIGGGVLALAALVGEIDLYADTSGHFTTSSEEQLTASYAPLVGLRWDPSSRVQLGLALRGESLSRYDILVKSDLSNILPFFALPTLNVAGVSQYDPLQIHAEVAFRPTAHWLLAVGVGWAHWSAFPAPVELATSVSNPPPPGFVVPAPFNFHDIVVPRASLEWWVQRGPLRTTLRAGYLFAESPAPDTPSQIQLDANRHVATGGLDLALTNRYAPLHLAVFGQWHQIQPNSRVSGYFGTAGLSLGADL